MGNVKIEDIDDADMFFTTKDKEGKDKEYCINELALAVLLANDVCFLNQRPYSYNDVGKSKEEIKKTVKIDGSTTIVYVNCSDLFYWGGSDAEDLPLNEIGNLYRMWKVNKQWGSYKWCCLRRKLRPQVPIVKDMKEDKFWDADLEALPKPEPS